MPVVDWVQGEDGVHNIAYRDLDDGRKLERITCIWYPNVRCIPSVKVEPGPGHYLSWVVPQDDKSCRSFAVMKVAEDFEFESTEIIPGKRWSEMTEEEHRRYPGDWEAQTGQGQITLHSEEHLGGSDGSIRLMRKGLRTQIKRVRNGEDPAGIILDEKDAMVEVISGNFFSEKD